MSESKKSVNQKSVEQVEQEHLTRRAALRKLGFGAGLSAFMLLGVDDLARMVGTKMAQTARDNKTAEQVAKEFQSAGVALADGSASGAPCISNYDCSGCGGSAATGDCCSGSSDPSACCGKAYGPSVGTGNTTACQQCCQHANSAGSSQLSTCNQMCLY